MTGTLVGAGVAFALIVCRVPIGAALLLAGSLGLLLTQPRIGDTLATLSFSPFESFTILAVPLFILAAELLLRSGIMDLAVRLLLRAARQRRWIFPPGVVGVAMFFAGITGSSVAEAAALGRLVYPTMRRLGFSERSIGGLVAVSANLGILLPPSLILIVYGTVTQTSISDLFLAALIPGLVGGALLMVVSLAFVRPKYPSTIETDGVGDAPEKTPQGRAPAANGGSRSDTITREFDAERSSIGPSDPGPTGAWLRVPAQAVALGLPPIIIFGGIYGGFGTPTEIAGVLVVYAAGVTILFKGVRGFGSGLRRSAQDNGSIFLLIIGAGVFAFVATVEGVPQAITASVTEMGLSKWQFLLAMNLLLVALGLFLDGLSMLLVAVPLLYKPALALGVDPVQLGVIMTVNIELATITPPVGVNLFAISAVSGMSYGDTVRSVIPYYPISVLLLVLVTYVPWLTLGPWNFGATALGP